MLCCVNEELKEQRRINKEIEKQIKKDRKSAPCEFILLLLGIKDFIKLYFIHETYCPFKFSDTSIKP